MTPDPTTPEAPLGTCEHSSTPHRENHTNDGDFTRCVNWTPTTPEAEEPSDPLFAYRQHGHDHRWCSEGCKASDCEFGPCCVVPAPAPESEVTRLRSELAQVREERDQWIERHKLVSAKAVALRSRNEKLEAVGAAAKADPRIARHVEGKMCECCPDWVWSLHSQYENPCPLRAVAITLAALEKGTEQ